MTAKKFCLGLLVILGNLMWQDIEDAYISIKSKDLNIHQSSCQPANLVLEKKTYFLLQNTHKLLSFLSINVLLERLKVIIRVMFSWIHLMSVICSEQGIPDS